VVDIAVVYQGAWACRSALPHYVDNGDGTVTDNQTGLMWEKKDGTCTVAGPHCWTNFYTWTVTGTAPDGTLYTDFLPQLNDTTCYAGYCDWRIPKLGELRSVVTSTNCGYPPSPCIDPIWGPTQADFLYWSSSSAAGNPGYAWGIYFFGEVSSSPKNSLSYARAVRGGR
jgi:hypothetical protein